MVIQEYWHQTADERLGNPPVQDNQQPLVVKDKSVECDTFFLKCFGRFIISGFGIYGAAVVPDSGVCWLDNRKGIQPVKGWVLVCWW